MMWVSVLRKNEDRWGSKYWHIKLGSLQFFVAWQIYGKKLSTFDPYIHTNWPWLIRKAYGKRRVSSRAKHVMAAYPTWTQDLLSNFWNRMKFQKKWHFDYVVVSTEGTDHGANYAAELAKFKSEDDRKAEKDAWTPDRVAEMRAHRNIAREAKDFARADELRKQLELAGFTVNDERIGK